MISSRLPKSEGIGGDTDAVLDLDLWNVNLDGEQEYGAGV